MAEYIDRDALLRKKHGCDREDCSNCDFFTDGDSWCQGELFAVDVLHAPAADVVERKTGKWVKISPAGIYECSQCRQNVMTSDIEAYKFCHGCGAKMIGGDDDV